MVTPVSRASQDTSTAVRIPGVLLRNTEQSRRPYVIETGFKTLTGHVQQSLDFAGLTATKRLASLAVLVGPPGVR